MELASTDFEAKGIIPARCGCDGDDQPPELHWSGIPDDAVELAIICEDVDAPGGTFVHWVLWAVDPATTGVGPDHPVKGGVEGVNDFENIGYGGPCPPPGHGYHHYHFRLYALSDHVDLPAGAAVNELRRAMAGKMVAEAELVRGYSR